jgi:hypothetical protein
MTKKNTALKGRKLVNFAKAILEAQGAKVEVAQNVVRWWQDKATKRWVPRSVKHDLFGVWDILAIHKDGARVFYQVTTLDNLSGRREKIKAAGQWTASDAILAWVKGRGRHFRVYYGPDFDESIQRWQP